MILLKDLLFELNDLGDRIALGMPMSQGAIGAGSTRKTFNSPDIAQDPAKFGTEIVDKNTISQGARPQLGSPLSQFNNLKQNIYKKGVDSIKYKVTPDEIIAGLEYELGHMVLKDSQIAKNLVIKNLKSDPKYYSNLHCYGVYPGNKNDDMPITDSDDEDYDFDVEDIKIPQLY